MLKEYSHIGTWIISSGYIQSHHNPSQPLFNTTVPGLYVDGLFREDIDLSKNSIPSQKIVFPQHSKRLILHIPSVSGWAPCQAVSWWSTLCIYGLMIRCQERFTEVLQKKQIDFQGHSDRGPGVAILGLLHLSDQKKWDVEEEFCNTTDTRGSVH